MSDLYLRMGKELRSLFNDLFDPARESQVRAKIAQILATAAQIGGSIQAEADRLNHDIDQYLKQPNNPKLVTKMKEHAMRLEQETREI